MKPSRPPSDSEKSEIAAAYQSGASMRSLCAKYDLGFKPMRKVLMEFNLYESRASRIDPKEEVLAKLFDNGNTAIDAARILGVDLEIARLSRKRWRSRCAKAAVREKEQFHRMRASRGNFDPKRVVRLWQMGALVEGISHTTGQPLTRVRAILRSAGFGHQLEYQR